ncbi:hypothetical protein F4818DRAFT_451936 [Hypoxylon cercidicola]|nr:hypothetical protein F4818DRAFT_451936 [Hypoxylon cercidicola]
MDTTNLPEGVGRSAVRKCLEYPLSQANNGSLSERCLDRVERDCWHGTKCFGCTEGYCWKTCGDGPWCYTAYNDGSGDWYTCKSDGDCQESYPCSQAVGGGASCGCSC